mmetsp:Transcript_20251/g.34820  ORF Transcript_20251/g.34820 Transcript_20251/m.34820 type:complete len:344 (+) Transcript_20251:671-1702(+)
MVLHHALMAPRRALKSSAQEGQAQNPMASPSIGAHQAPCTVALPRSLPAPAPCSGCAMMEAMATVSTRAHLRSMTARQHMMHMADLAQAVVQPMDQEWQQLQQQQAPQEYLRCLCCTLMDSTGLRHLVWEVYPLPARQLPLMWDRLVWALLPVTLHLLSSCSSPRPTTLHWLLLQAPCSKPPRCSRVGLPARLLLLVLMASQDTHSRMAHLPRRATMQCTACHRLMASPLTARLRVPQAVVTLSTPTLQLLSTATPQLPHLPVPPTLRLLTTLTTVSCTLSSTPSPQLARTRHVKAAPAHCRLDKATRAAGDTGTVYSCPYSCLRCDRFSCSTIPPHTEGLGK